ncbi:hypothetical protein FA378_31105 [Pseudomonas aeruginosa]|uniref:hypothetical protein n=1 Tax=Pseudomonas aeruginosa TaxID=287 RepID=UPI003D2AAEF8|nr:hypothetical protein [Pseudomonas aeruginosa]HBO5143994.1 hypothetical protein [Pseudomonas aeruginosa]
MVSNSTALIPYLLDDRDLSWHLRRWRDEAKKRPFEGETHWDDVWFPQGVEALLAELGGLLKLPNGNLAPHQAFLLAFLRQLETPRDLLNTVLPRHRELYYRQMLGVSERPAVPDRVVVGAELVGGEQERLIPAGTLLDGGQDAQQNPQHYALDRHLLANAGRCSDLFYYRPGAQGAAGRSRRVYSEADGITWPEGGLRLFEAAVAEDETPALGGRLIASAALALNRGERVIKLGFSQKPEAPERLLAWVTAGGEWLPVATSWSDPLLALSLSAEAPAIEAAPGLDGWSFAKPLLKLVHQDGLAVPPVKDVWLTVTDAQDPWLATDEGRVGLNEPVHPFGLEPKRGNAFYLTCSDWVKPAGTLTLTLTPEWQGLPEESFGAWYTGYTSIGGGALVPPMANNSFKLKAFLRHAQGGVAPVELTLFAGANDSAPQAHDWQVAFDAFSQALPDSQDPRDGPCLCLELANQDFRHDEYWYHQTTATPESPLWKPPRTALLKRLRVKYEYTCDLDGGDDVQVVLTPFGHANVWASQDQHLLYLGWSGVRPGQELSLYWKLRSPLSQAVTWSYLRQGNDWAPLDAEIRDETEGFSRSGLWRTRLPGDAADAAPAMPAGRHWLRAVWQADDGGMRAEETAPPSSMPWLYGVLSNAVTATRVSGEDPVLPGDTIAHPVETLDGVQGFLQPWPSEGGQAAEDMPAFMARIARRLVHRQRILTRQDIPVLLLERFPELYDVRLAETAQASEEGEDERTLHLVVIPVPHERDNTDPLRPLLNPARLERMAAEVRRLASPWLAFELSNPLYRDVAVRYRLRFQEGLSPDFGYQQTREALTSHYMPWGEADSDAAVALGVDLDYYQLLTVIQGQPWVEQVLELTLDGGQEAVAAGPLEVLILEFGDPLAARDGLSAAPLPR